MKNYNVAILGATGAVGQELVELLQERKFPIESLKLLASARSAGRVVQIGGENFTIEEAKPESFTGVDLAFFSAGGSVSETFVEAARASGTVVIDNTSAFRLNPEVPLVVPEVNGDDLAQHKGLIANPNCSTTIGVMALAPLHARARIKRVVFSTYQAVSGIGAAAIDDLNRQVEQYVKGETITAETFPSTASPKQYPMLFNLIPHIDSFDEGDYTKEEWKMVRETQKILHDDDLAITCTTVRVPVFRSHSESINVEFHDELGVEEARRVLAKTPGIKVFDNPQEQEYPMPIMTTYDDSIWVGRIRKDYSVPYGLNLWVVGDQIRKGAALNSVQIAEELINRELL
ncbi:MAG: aspartate-semialdehyde dehydrogenase [Firmicutes bacterium]|nr:aspartate-semialdehyde dehydrogenase [Bacillota bacterium]